MKKSKFTAEQIIDKLREAGILLDGVCGHAIRRPMMQKMAA